MKFGKLVPLCFMWSSREEGKRCFESVRSLELVLRNSFNSLYSWCNWVSQRNFNTFLFLGAKLVLFDFVTHYIHPVYLGCSPFFVRCL